MGNLFFWNRKKRREDIKKRSRIVATIIVNTIDKISAYKICEISGTDTDKIDQFFIEKEEKELLVEYWSEVIKKNNAKTPNWLMLIITNLVVYIPKIEDAKVIKQDRVSFKNIGSLIKLL